MDWIVSDQIEAMLEAGFVGSIDDCRRVKDYLAQSFATYLGQDIEPVWEPIYEDISPNWGFSFGIRSSAALGGPLALEWYAVISHGHGHTQAIVLLFADDERAIQFEEQDYLFFEYMPKTTKARVWQSRGWRTGECGEWDGYQRLSIITKQMRALSEKLTSGQGRGYDESGKS
jgi:hypothetical protein